MRRREEEERILGLMGSCVSLSFAEGAQCPPAGDPDVWRCGIRHPHQDVHCEFSALHFSIGLVSQPHQGTPVFVAPLACASHSAVMVSHILPRNLCSRISLQSLDCRPDCFSVPWPELYCCPLPVLGLN